MQLRMKVIKTNAANHLDDWLHFIDLLIFYFYKVQLPALSISLTVTFFSPKLNNSFLHPILPYNLDVYSNKILHLKQPI